MEYDKCRVALCFNLFNKSHTLHEFRTDKFYPAEDLIKKEKIPRKRLLQCAY